MSPKNKKFNKSFVENKFNRISLFGISKDDPRAHCYKASFKYIKAKKPKVVLIEQVPGVLTNKQLKNDIFKRWMGMLLCRQFEAYVP